MPSKNAPIKPRPFTVLDLFFWAFLLATCAFTVVHLTEVVGAPVGMPVDQMDVLAMAKLGLFTATKIGLGLALGAVVFCILQSFLHDPTLNTSLSNQIWAEMLIRVSTTFTRPLPGQYRPPRFTN